MRSIPVFVALLCGFASLVSARPAHDASGLEERQSSVVVTTGASNGVLPRLEIRQLQNTKPNQWILFILAMQQWQQQSQNAPYTTSYFGIAKIHGVPEASYNNVPNCASCKQSLNIWGYCTHSSVLFPAWHRAYLALFEQEFLKVVHSIVPKFPASRQATMRNAANQMRLPYYDWAAIPPNGGPAFPTAMSSSTLSINGPSGPQTIANPLVQITFKDPSSMYYPPFTSYKTTMRYPTTANAGATSEQQKVVTAMSQNRPGLQQLVYQLLTNCKSYLSFSNNQGGHNSGCTNSLETLHDMVHVAIGGGANEKTGTLGGHMSRLPVASFDPAFWLHHAMVDRIFALWQTLNPNVYGASQTIGASAQTWTIPEGSTKGPDSALTPFYKDNGKTFWTTNSVRNWAKTFNYTYPEFSNSDGSASAIMSYVNKLYGPSATATAGSSKRTAGLDSILSIATTTASPLQTAAHESTVGEPSNAVYTSTYQWNANIQTSHFALDGNYNIFVFTNNPISEDPQSWITDPSFAGFAAVLMAARGPMSQLINNDTRLITSSVPLTYALQLLVSAGELPSLEPAVVTPYLTNNLSWRVKGPRGENVSPSEVPGLVIAASSTILQTSSNVGQIPQWSDFHIIPNITRGSAGGLNRSASWNATTVGQVIGNSTMNLLAHL